VTGTIGTSAIVVGVVGDGSLGADGEADGEGVTAGSVGVEDCGAVGVAPWPTGPPGLADGAGEPTSSTPMATATLAASRRMTVKRGARLTLAIVTAGHGRDYVRRGWARLAHA
jgi:hypothetical protein